MFSVLENLLLPPHKKNPSLNVEISEHCLPVHAGHWSPMFTCSGACFLPIWGHLSPQADPGDFQIPELRRAGGRQTSGDGQGWIKQIFLGRMTEVFANREL